MMALRICALLLTVFCLSPALCAAAPPILQPAEKIEGIYLGKTVVLPLEKPITRVAVGESDIAGVRAISDTQVLIKGIRLGTTNITLWYKHKARPDIFELQVETDPATFAHVEELVAELVPGAKVRIIPANAEILLEGEVSSIRDMQRVLQIVSPFFVVRSTSSKKDEKDDSTTYINISDGGNISGGGGSGNLLEATFNQTLAIRNNLVVVKGPQQVQLEVKIAEISRSGMKRMGLGFLNNQNWSVGLFPTGDATGRMQRQSGVDASTDLLSSNARISAPFSAAFQVLLHAADSDTLMMLSLLKGQGLAKILATPTLVAMSGQEATFLVGGEFPVPNSEGGDIEIEYKEYGTQLKFKPVVIDKETIHLTIEPMVSAPDYSLGTSTGGVAVPGVKTRTAVTTLQLKDGQSFVMAGLLKESVSSVTSKVPFLGDIPLLGGLFTSKEFSREESELVILVTPRLVRPLDPDEITPLPGETLANRIDDADFFLLNRTDLPTRSPAPAKPPPIEGGVGFYH
jgi:pilus assembly protein CpaC